MLRQLITEINENFWHFFSLDNICEYLSYFYLIFLIWGTIYGNDQIRAGIWDGDLFQVIALFVFSYISGEVMSLFNLPPLLGMLITGFIVGNVMSLNQRIVSEISPVIRQTALVIILLRAGLELDPKKIIRLSGVCLRLSFCPCIAEAVSVAISAYFIIGLHIYWGFLMGFVLAAVSPAVVVSGVIALKEKGYGTDKGLPTLLMAASSVDDILAISGVMVFLKLVFKSDSPLIWIIIKSPIDAIIGILIGLLFGMILWYIPRTNKQQTIEKQRVVLLLLMSLSIKFISNDLVEAESTGPLATLMTAFIAAIYWRELRQNKPIKKYMKIFWNVFQPLLFALIGTEVQIGVLESSRIGLGLICLLIGLTFRSLTAMIVVIGADLNFKEKMFVAMAWLPKATVQAATGTMALDMAKDKKDPNSVPNARLVLTIAVLSIIITAPLGSVLMAVCGPHLLHKADIGELTQKSKDFHMSTTEEEANNEQT